MLNTTFCFLQDAQKGAYYSKTHPKTLYIYRISLLLSNKETGPSSLVFHLPCSFWNTHDFPPHFSKSFSSPQRQHIKVAYSSSSRGLFKGLKSSLGEV